MAKKDDHHLVALCDNCGAIFVAYDNDGSLTPIGPPDRACSECGSTEFVTHPLQDDGSSWPPQNATDMMEE